MGISNIIDPSALFISAEGRKKEGYENISTFSELAVKVLSSKSLYDHPIKRMSLRYRDIEATVRTNRGTEKVIIDDYEYIYLFERAGELAFLKIMNEQQYELLLSRISKTKNQLSQTTDRIRANTLKNIIEDDENILDEFNKWFIYYDLEIPVTDNEVCEICFGRTNTRYTGLESILSIDKMHSLQFVKSKCTEYSDQVVFKIYNDEFETPEIKISQTDGSLLLFLAAERKKNEEKWLMSPNKYENVLLRIFNDLQLKKTREPSDIGWAKKDTKNSRYKITSRINKTVQEAGFLSGNLIINKQVDDYVKGIYSLSESIKNIEYSDQTGL